MASQKSAEVIESMIQLSTDVISLCQRLTLPRSVVDQLTRSVTSIGANFVEAQDASSKKDFLNKIYIAKKEASETKYWLAIIARLTDNPGQLPEVSDRVQKFVMRLQKIINSSRDSNRKLQMANSLLKDNR